MVALNLLHERSLGEASPFRVYIDQLPKQFDLLSQWSDDELRLLQYPAAARAAEGQRKEDDAAKATTLHPSTPWVRYVPSPLPPSPQSRHMFSYSTSMLVAPVSHPIHTLTLTLTIPSTRSPEP